MRVKESMAEWEQICKEGLPVMSWWEMIVKPGVRKIAMSRSKEINQERREEMNLLLLRQAYLDKKIQNNNMLAWSNWQTDLVSIQDQIQAFYSRLADKIKHQSRVDESERNECLFFSSNEYPNIFGRSDWRMNTRIYSDFLNLTNECPNIFKIFQVYRMNIRIFQNFITPSHP